MENRTLKILAIDDNHDNLITLQALVQDAFPEIEVFTAISGLRGLELAVKHDPDVILLDIVMPIMDGFEVCRRLKADSKLCEIPVVFVTALKGDAESRIRALESGGDAFLAKPIDESELTAQVRAMLKIRTATLDKRDENARLKRMVAEKTKELRKAQDHYSSILNELPALISEFLPDSTLTYVNRIHCTTLHMSESDLVGHKFLDYLPEAERIRAQRQYSQLTPSNPTNRYEEKLLVNGDPIWIEWRQTAVFDADNELLHYRSIGVDITQRKRSEDELVYLSFHDHLTDLYNRRYFEQSLERLDVPRNFPLTVVMGDLNGLKLINDSFGHAEGDKMLIEAAGLIKQGCRSDDIIARIGGDEFGVILPSTDSLEAHRLINRIRDAVASTDTDPALLSISFGLATKENCDQITSEVLADAENAMYSNKMYESASMRNQTIDIIMSTLFEKSSRELMHSKRVSHICAAIAAELGFDQEDVQKIGLAGLVHDIGKIGIDEKILNKTTKLTDSEWVEIKRHPEAGWRILNSSKEFSVLAEIIMHHHEKWDGLGYPKALSGESIPIESRIIAVADAFDAMTCDRAYRKGLSEEQAVDEIKRCSGTQFDPVVARTFVDKVWRAPGYEAISL